MSPLPGAPAPPPLTVYHTRYQPDPGAQWQSGLNVALGFAWDPNNEIPQPVVELGGQDISSYVTLSDDSNRSLLVHIDLSSVSDAVCGTTPQLYVGGNLQLSPDGASFTGTITRLCSGPVSCPWQGQSSLAGARWVVGMWRWTLAREALRKELASLG